MEERLDLLGDPHVVPQVLAADVRRRDDAIPRQLPDVKLVHRQNTSHLKSQKVKVWKKDGRFKVMWCEGVT